MTEPLPNVRQQIREAFEKGKSKHGKHWHYDGPDYARRKCEHIIELYEEKTLPKIKHDVLEKLDGLAEKIEERIQQLKNVKGRRSGVCQAHEAGELEGYQEVLACLRETEPQK